MMVSLLRNPWWWRQRWLGLLGVLRNAFAWLFGKGGTPEPKIVKLEIPGERVKVKPLAPPRPPRKRYRVGRWSWEPFPPAKLLIAASRLGRIVEFDGLDHLGRRKWRMV